MIYKVTYEDSEINEPTVKNVKNRRNTAQEFSASACREE
jgi:hypothetical protein